MFSIKRSIAGLICLFIALCIRAQFVNYGTDPAKYKWNIIHTDHYKLIYPQGNDSMAYQYARLLETSYPRIQKTIGVLPKRAFPVILHPSNMLSNGMVAWAPRRMELITTPSADLYAQTWDRQLVLHESRHVFQTRKFLQGVFNPLYYLVGEQAAGVSSFLVPTWFLEGDAVTTETAISNSGRGRLPEFNMIYRAHMIENNFYSFDKWFLGSYENYTGTKYALGYNLVSYARYEYGADIWNKVTTRYAKHIWTIPPFSSALKRCTGYSKNDLYKKTFAFLGQEWKKQEDDYRKSGFSVNYLTPETTDYTTYKYPQILDESTFVALKTNFKDIPSLVRIRNGKEELLIHLGNINSRIVYKNNRIYWTEYVSGLRWSHENYSVLKYYDLQTGRIKTLTPKQRFQSPDVSDDGSTVAVSEFSESGNNRIVLLDTENGTEIASYNTPFNSFAKEISYAGNDRLIVTTIGDDGIAIRKLDVLTNSWEEILKPTWANITATSWKDNKLWFESGVDGTNNIYCLDIDTKKPYRVTTARFGAFTPTLSPDNKTLFFSDYQTSGYRIASVSLDKLSKEAADFENPYRFALAETIGQQEAFSLDTAQLKEIDFNPKRYNKLLNLFKIHSWAPFYYNASDIINGGMDDFSTIVKPGAMTLSQNSLNTAITQLGWYYKDSHHHGQFAFTYMGWYPVIDLNVDYGGKAFDLAWTKNEEERDVTGYVDPNRTRLEAEAHIYIPFNLTRNQYIKGIQPSITYYYTNDRFQKFGTGKFEDFQYIQPEVRIYNYRRMSYRDILPRWGYQLRMQYLSSLFNSDNFGQLYAARATAYLPGVFSNNSLMLRAGYQYQDLGIIYLPKQLINAPRGYNYNYRTRQLVEFKADYAFSFMHPDWSIGPLAYIKRLRSNLFYDISFNQANENSGWSTQSSVGMDFLFDWNGFQSDFPIATGVRLIKPIENGGIKSEILFSISF